MSNKMNLEELLTSSGIDSSVLKSIDKKGVKSGIAFGIKSKMIDLLIEYAEGRKVSLLSVLPKVERKKLSAEGKKEAKARMVSVIDWHVARKAVQDEVRRMNKNVSGKGTVSDEVAAEYGVYRTDDKGRFLLVPKLPGSRQQQMVSLVKKTKAQLASSDKSYVAIGADDTLTIVIE